MVFAERTDSAIIPAARVNSPCPREVGHRPPCDDSGRVREEYEKGTIAGDDPKAFRDKYRFLLFQKWLKAKAHEVPKHIINAWNRYLARDPPSYDSGCLLYTSPSPRDVEESRMPSSA